MVAGFLIAAAAGVTLVLPPILPNSHDSFKNRQRGDISFYLDMADADLAVAVRALSATTAPARADAKVPVNYRGRYLLSEVANRSLGLLQGSKNWLHYEPRWSNVFFQFYYTTQAEAVYYDELRRRFLHVPKYLFDTAVLFIRGMQALIPRRVAGTVGFSAIHVRVGDRFPFPLLDCFGNGYVIDTHWPRGTEWAACTYNNRTMQPQSVQPLVTMAEVCARRFASGAWVYVATNNVRNYARGRRGC